MITNSDIRRIVRSVIMEQYGKRSQAAKNQAFMDMRQDWENEHPLISDDEYEYEPSAEDGRSMFNMDAYKSNGRNVRFWNNDEAKLNRRAAILHSRDYQSFDKVKNDINNKAIDSRPSQTYFDEFHDGDGFDDEDY